MSTCKQCGEPVDEVGYCINYEHHEREAMLEKHRLALEDAADVIVDLFHSGQRIAAVQPNCEGLLRSLLRASEYLRARGVRR